MLKPHIYHMFNGANIDIKLWKTMEISEKDLTYKLK